MTARLQSYALVFAGLVIPLLVLRPFQNVPFRDDWTYAWSVENLLNHHTLRILDWSTHINVIQILWGALFCLPFGFSFTALRVSTWALSLLGLAGFYLLMRELRVPERNRAIALGTLACSPLYVLLSFSFMTDVPAITFSTWSVFCFIKGLQSQKNGWFFVGSLVSMMSIGTRLTGLAVPLGVLLYSVFQRPSRPRKWTLILLGGVVPLLFAVALVFWHTYHVEYRADLRWLVGSPQRRASELHFAFTGFHRWLVVTVSYIVAPLGFLLAPVAVGFMKRFYSRKALLASGIVVAVFTVAHFTGYASPVGSQRNWFDLANLGGSYSLVWSSPEQGVEITPGWSLFADLVGTLLFCGGIGPALVRIAEPSRRLLTSVLFAQFLFIVVLWLWSSRYFLALLPPLLPLILTAALIHRAKFALTVVALFAAASFVVVHDELTYNSTLWRAVDDLLKTGTPIQRIDGGYTVNGWLQYAHKENAKTQGRDVQVEMVNVETDDSDFKLANRPESGWVRLREYPYVTWFAPSGRIYVLARKAPEGG
jgi:hypothetical protein